MPQPVLAVVSVLGKDQKGVVAQFATYLAERGINIEDIEQRVVRGFFLMDMLVDLKDLSVDLSELITGLLDLGRRIDMEVRVHLHSERRKKKIALLVSKEPHCLKQLIDRFRRPQYSGPHRRRLSNHPDLRADRRKANVPFAMASGRRPGAALRVAARTSCNQQQPDLVVLARYMRILPAEFVAAYPHQDHQHSSVAASLLPRRRPYKQAYESGVRVHGCTAHFVTEQLDEGPVILAGRLPHQRRRRHVDDVKAQRPRPGSEDVLSKAVQLFLDEELVVVEGKVIFKPGISRFLKSGKST